MKNVVVTGSHGYIGSVLCKYLKRNGYNVVGIDNAASKNSRAHRYCNLVVEESFTSPPAFEYLYAADIIFHLAATSEVGPSATQPALYYENNAGKTARLMMLLDRWRWSGHLVFASTAAVYAAKNTSLTEQDITMPVNNYGHSKLMCERILQAQSEALDSQSSFYTTVFRFFNVAGAWEELGEPQHDSHLITRICSAAVKRDPVLIFGDNYPTPDGTCVRDYIHVRDVARAMLHVTETVPKYRYRTYNLGTQNGISVKQMVSKFTELAPLLESSVVSPRSGDAPVLIADPSLFKQETDFWYKYSDTDNIVNSAWQHYRGYYGV